jgi:AcrR family transcriptional regulator
VPAVAKTSDDAIASAARRLLEDGAEVSMAAVAAAIGIRAPSLYKRFADRDALIGRLRRDAYDALAARLSAVERTTDAREYFRRLARAYRAFALEHPRVYALLFEPGEDTDERVASARAAAVSPVLEVLRAAIGAEHALAAARTVTAFLHGHVSMVQAGAFRLGGDVESAFAYGVERLLDGLLGCPGPDARADETQRVRPQ